MKASRTREAYQTIGVVMTAEEMRAALAELGWKQADLCRKTGKSENTVSTWAKDGPPLWVGEYLGALLAIERMYSAFIKPTKPSPAPIPTPEEKQRRVSRAARMAKKVKNTPDLFSDGKP